MTTAADQFLDALDVVWDSLDPYEATAAAGFLAEPDTDALRILCDATGDDYETAEAEVMEYIRGHVARARGRVAGA